MGPEFREDPASISAEEQARRRKVVADQRAPPSSLRSGFVLRSAFVGSGTTLRLEGPPSSCWFQ